jgi:D-tyrosyl-tRNA(Tyr) deacylase
MLALIQRVKSASVEIKGIETAAIEQGLLLFLGVEKNDSQDDADILLQKVLTYRVFSDPKGKMNLNVQDVQGGLLVVSQFTLAADTKKGLRPSFSSAKAPEEARQLYDYFLHQASERTIRLASGEFAADMQIALINDGPVTFLLQS